MAPKSDHFSITVSHRGPGNFAGQSIEPTVIWMTGEHDASNASLLSQLVAEVIALDDSPVVIDLAGVSFMGGATIAIFIRANSFLVARSRTLILRNPSRPGARLLALCGLAHLVSPPSPDSVEARPRSEALRTWVDVPTEERDRRRQLDARPAPPGRIDASTPSVLANAISDSEKARREST